MSGAPGAAGGEDVAHRRWMKRSSWGVVVRIAGCVALFSAGVGSAGAACTALDSTLAAAGVPLHLRLAVSDTAAQPLAGDTLDVMVSARWAGEEVFPGGKLILRWVSEGAAEGKGFRLPTLLPGDSLRIFSDVVVPYVERSDTLRAEAACLGDTTVVAVARLPVAATLPGDRIASPAEGGEIEALSAAGPYLLRVGEGFARLFDVERGVEMPEWTLPASAASLEDGVFLFARDGMVFLADIDGGETRVVSDPAFAACDPAAGKDHLLWVRDRCGTPGEIVLLSRESGARSTIPLDGPLQSPPSIGKEWVAWCTESSRRVEVWAASVPVGEPFLLLDSEDPLVGPVVGDGGVLYGAMRDSLWAIHFWNGETGKARRIETCAGPLREIAARRFLCAWSEGAPGDEEIYARDVRGSRRIPVALGPGAQVMPAPGDSSVFWVDRRWGRDEVKGLRLRIPARWMDGPEDERNAVQVTWESVEARGTVVRLGWRFQNVEDACAAVVYRVPHSAMSVSPDDEVAARSVDGPGLHFFEDRTVPAVGEREWVNYFVGVEVSGDSALFGPFLVLLPERPPRARVGPAGPNPTREEPRLSISIPVEMEGEPVEMRVYDCRGRLVRRLSEGEARVGSRVLGWDRRNEAGQPVGPGVYFLQVRVGDRFQETKKAVLLSP